MSETDMLDVKKWFTIKTVFIFLFLFCILGKNRIFVGTKFLTINEADLYFFLKRKPDRILI